MFICLETGPNSCRFCLVLKGAGTSENTLIGILCSRSNEEIEQIKEEYKTRMYNCIVCIFV